MSTMVIELYEALLEAGASKEKAKKAAEVASGFVRMDNHDLSTKEDIHKLDIKLGVVEAKLGMLQWMIGGLGFGIVLLLIENFAR